MGFGGQIPPLLVWEAGWAVFAKAAPGQVIDQGTELKNALKTYTDAKGKGKPTLKAEKATQRHWRSL